MKPIVHRHLLHIGILWCISLTCIIVYSHNILWIVSSLKTSFWSSSCPFGHVVLARLHRQTARRCERVRRSGAQSKASVGCTSTTPGQCSHNSWRKYLSLSFCFSFSFTHSFVHSFILSFSLFFFAGKCLPISLFVNDRDGMEQLVK